VTGPSDRNRIIPFRSMTKIHGSVSSPQALKAGDRFWAVAGGG
jgi:hypothetical protein